MEVKNRETAEKAVKRGAELSALLASTVATKNRCVLGVEKRFGGTISQLCDELTEIETALADWSKGNRSEFGEKQSIDFPCGVLAFRLGNRAIEPLKGFTWETILKTVRRLASWRKYLRIKIELNKQKLLSDTAGDKPKLKPERLEKIGAQIVQAENFEVEFRLKTKLNKKA